MSAKQNPPLDTARFKQWATLTRSCPHRGSNIAGATAPFHAAHASNACPEPVTSVGASSLLEAELHCILWACSWYNPV